MNKQITRLTLDVGLRDSYKVVFAKMGDTERRVIAEIKDNGEDYSLAGVNTVEVRCRKADGKQVTKNATKDNNTIVIDISGQMTTCKGIAIVDVVLYGTGGGVLSTAKFYLNVDDGAVSEDDIKSSNEYENLIEALRTVGLVKEVADTALNTANTAEEKVKKLLEKMVDFERQVEQIVKNKEDIDSLKEDLSQLSEEIANLSGGLNSTAKSLLITILRDGIYNADQSANITALSVALENTSGDNTSVPTESISITGDTTVNFGKSLILTATLTPSNTTDSVVWTSSDETIATVTGSGSKNTVGTVTGIKGGTVTIRAIAGSVSKTYTVTVVENVLLPDGYTALDYIASTWKSSFDTGITADENTSAEYKISFIQLGPVHVLADNGAYAFPTSSGDRKVRSKRGGTDYNYSYTLSTDTIYTIKAFAENGVNVNGTNIDTNSVVGNTPSGNGTLIFNNYGSVKASYGAMAKYYYMKIWEGENLIRWYIPCKDTNGVVGMYDVVGNTFNTNTNYEDFTEV